MIKYDIIYNTINNIIKYNMIKIIIIYNYKHIKIINIIPNNNNKYDTI